MALAAFVLVDLNQFPALASKSSEVLLPDFARPPGGLLAESTAGLDVVAVVVLELAFACAGLDLSALFAVTALLSFFAVLAPAPASLFFDFVGATGGFSF